MMRKLKFFSLAALAAFAFAACDEGGTNVVTGTISGSVTAEGQGLSGVTVTLSSGASTATDASGNYSFSNVDGGTYTVQITPPSDVTFSSTTQTAVVATAGQTVSVNFSGSFVRTSSILGSVAVAGVGGLEGVTVTLSGAGSATTTTDVAGQYAFSGLRAGSYTVTISNFGSTMYTFPNTSQTATVAAGESEVVSFSGSQLANARIMGRLYLDENDKNDTFDGETLENNLEAANVLITLTGPGVGETQTTQTDSTGMYEFSDLVAGNYQVAINPADPDIPAFAAYGGSSTSFPVTVNTGGVAEVDFPFDISQQTVTVCSFTGIDSVNPGHAPVSGSTIKLYPTELDAVGDVNAFGTQTTDATGCTTFSFARAADRSPQPGLTDNIVFAQFFGNSTPLLTLNGENRIETAYDPTTASSLAADTFDLLNSRVGLSFDATTINGVDTLNNWAYSAWLDTTAVARKSGVTNAAGVATLVDTIGPTSFPVTYYVRLAEGIGSQPAPAGNQLFEQTPDPDSMAGAATRYLTYTANGFQAPGANVFLGTEEVRFLTADIVVAVHHEADDSLVDPLFTGGDDITNVDEIEVSLWYVPSSGAAPVLVTSASPAPGVNTVTFNSFFTDTTYAVTAHPVVGFSSKVVLNDTIQTVVDWGGQSFEAEQCQLEGSAGCSTFAYKYDNTSLTGLVRAADGTDADGIHVRVTVDSMTIQPNVTDTTLTVSGGSYSLGGLIEGTYHVEVFDSVTAGGDSIWSFFGSQSPKTAELEGNADNDILNFVATRMDTKILGVVINDRDADNNTIDPNEALAGVTIQLYKGAVAADSLIATDTTDAEGEYVFEGLREGTYVLKADASGSLTAATVLRTISAAGVVADTAIVTTGATTTGLGANLTRQVGDTVFGSPGLTTLPRWDYGQTQGNFVTPSHFTFLFDNTTARGTIVDGAAAPVAGMTVTLRRCKDSAGATSPPTAGTCTTYLPGAPQNVATDANGQFEFTGLQEGVYEITPNPVTAGFATVTPASLLYLLVDSGDIEVPAANLVAN
ncbi:MAG: carboxypeptidase regulatory-like domain-containing protein [Gemmatimonadota bacterium]